MGCRSLGVGIHAPGCHTGGKPLCLLQIIHTDSNTVLGQNDTGFSCDGSSNTFRVMFKEPVEVLPNVNYTACATLKVPGGAVGLRGRTQGRGGGREGGSAKPRAVPEPPRVPAGPRFSLRHQRAAQGDSRIAHQRRQDLLHLLLRGREQQRHFGGGRTDPRDHLLHIVPPRGHGAAPRPPSARSPTEPRSAAPNPTAAGLRPPLRPPPAAVLSVGASPPAGSAEVSGAAGGG